MPIIDITSKVIIAHTDKVEDVKQGTIIVTKEPGYIITYRVVDITPYGAWCRYRSQVCVREDRV